MESSNIETMIVAKHKTEALRDMLLTAQMENIGAMLEDISLHESDASDILEEKYLEL